MDQFTSSWLFLLIVTDRTHNSGNMMVYINIYIRSRRPLLLRGLVAVRRAE